MRILIAVGGTGGHLFPAQQLAEMLKKEAKIHFAGHKLSTSPFFEKTGISFTEIDAHPLKKGFFKATWKGFWAAIRLVKNFSPDVIVGFGSFHVFPILLAAVILRKKLVLFEANTVLGKVNRLFRFHAIHMVFQFPISGRKEDRIVPLLPWNVSLDEKMDPKEARKRFGLHPEKITLLVVGGSQGAAFLNEVAPLALRALKVPLQVIHLTGPDEEEKVRKAYEVLGILACVKAFEKQMKEAYAAADIAFSRSGAGTIAELIRFQIPALLIPYPFATEDHQKKNGDFLVDKVKGARLLIQKEATVEKISKELQHLLHNKNEYKNHLEKAKLESQGRPTFAGVLIR